MTTTRLTGKQVKDASIQRDDLDTATAGQAVVAKIIQGAGTSLSSTGGDSGTGDVTVALADPLGVGLHADKDVAFQGDISPAQLTANTDNWNPTGLSTASVIRASTDAARTITGLAGGADGRVMVLLNIGSNTITLAHDSASSTAANRFRLPNLQSFVIDPGCGTMILYDSTSSRWAMLETFFFSAVNPSAIGTAAQGTSNGAARRDHVHPTGAGTPSTQAFGDAAATGTGPAAAMTDHKHAMPGNPGLLAALSYSAGSNYSATPAVFTDVDATNLAITFTAPASGNVLVRLTSSVSGGSAVSHFFGLREGSTDITGNGQHVNSVTTSQISSVAFLITGLTPGSSHTYKWAWKATSGTMQLLSGTGSGQVMEVWVAP